MPKRRKLAARHRRVARIGAVVTLRSSPTVVGVVMAVFVRSRRVHVRWSNGVVWPSGPSYTWSAMYSYAELRRCTKAEEAAWRLQ